MINISRAKTLLSLSTTPSGSMLRTNIQPATRPFSSGSVLRYAIEKKPLSKKITIPRDPYLLSEKVVKFARNGKLDDAITLVMEAPKSRQNEVVWNHLIQESSKLGKTSQSWQLLNDMKKRSFEPSVRTYTILLNALAINPASPNSVSRARSLYQQMQDSEDTPPTVVHTNALLKVCGRKLDYKAMQDIYATMPKDGSNSPDVVTFNILINTYARKGGDEGFESAWKVWEDFLAAKTRRPDEIILDQALVDAVLLACREAKSPSYMRRGYKLVESLYGLTDPFKTTLAGKDPKTLAGASEPSKGLGLGPVLRKETIHPRTVENLLSISSKLRDYNKGQRFIDLVHATYPDFKPDPQLLSSMMHFQIAAKEYEKAVATWDEIGANGLYHTRATFQQGLDAALKARNWEKTSEMYAELQRQIKSNRGSAWDARRINPIVREQDAWTLLTTLKCAIKTKHVQEGLDILRETSWMKVVQNPRYSRSNADVAQCAVKIYSSVLKNNAANPHLKGEPVPQLSEDERAKIEKELAEARALHTKLVQVLATHDDAKEQQALIDRENYRRPKSSTFSSDVSEAPLKEGEDVEVGSGWRKVAPEDHYSSRQNRWGSNTTSSRPERFESTFRNRSKDQSQFQSAPRSKPQRQDQGRRFENAFVPSKRFTREFPE